MRACSDLIRIGAAVGEFDDLPESGDLFDDDAGAREGRLLERRHLRRERDRKLRDSKIRQVLKLHGRLACEVCGFDFELTYGERGKNFAECHHTIPLHVSGETKTRLRRRGPVLELSPNDSSRPAMANSGGVRAIVQTSSRDR